VEILTFHGAKGREWDFVIVAGAESGLLPHSSAKTPQQKAEETRLAYVALTRAGHQLVITWAQSRNSRKSTKSPLLDGLPTSLSTPQPDLSIIQTNSAHAKKSRSLMDDLTAWRLKWAKDHFLDPDAVCSFSDLQEIDRVRPRNEVEITQVLGFSAHDRLSTELLKILELH
jgi:DNA helicase-2/ATP-dependent DNA helicase PcrA